jgi:hypothetical protein
LSQLICFDDVREVNSKLLAAMEGGIGAQLDLGETLLVYRLLSDKILPLESPIRKVRVTA